MARLGRTAVFFMLAAQLAATACSSGGHKNPDAGTGGAGGQGCVLNAGAQDWFAGVWSGVQSNETFTVTNGGGCTIWEGIIGGTLCDYCTGTYAITGATATATLSCEPRNPCSVSPIHTDTGTLTQSGCTFVYDYQFAGASGSGSATFTGPNRIADAVTNVCATADAATD